MSASSRRTNLDVAAAKPTVAPDILFDSRPYSVKRKSLRLATMHYHLKPGGVVSVMRDTARALSFHSLFEPLQIDVIASVDSEEHARGFFDGVREDGRRGRFRVLEVPELAYRHKPYGSRAAFLQASEELATKILKLLDVESSAPDCPFVLHSHNVSLGKNPSATMAFKRIGEMAAEHSLPLWLINQVHDFAENKRPEQLSAFRACTGRYDEGFARSFMYPMGGNMVYLTINTSDMENLVELGIPADRIFLLPDPVDVAKLEQKPLWELDSQAFAGLKAPPSDYREEMLRRLADFASCTRQVFDASLPVLLSPLKVMRRKNNVESLLLSVLFGYLGQRYQLLITLDANSKHDIDYSEKLKAFAGSRKLPLVIGFGNEMITGAAKRQIRNGKVERFSMCDLNALCAGVVTTSVVEGFGFAYHEGWVSHRPVVGRKIPGLVRDFEANGMALDHLYNRLAVSMSDLPGLRHRFFEAYARALREPEVQRDSPCRMPESVPNEKLFRLGGEDCVDFADLNAEMQFELIDSLLHDRSLATRFLDRNPVVTEAYGLLRRPPPELIESNGDVVRSRYSLEAMARRLENLIARIDSIYRQPCEAVELTAERHAAVINRYRSIQNMRLLF